MRTLFFLLIYFTATLSGYAQKTAADSMVAMSKTTINKDPRIEILGKKMAEYNDGLSMNPHSGRGYRLMIISTSDREQAMKIRSELYQIFPDQKQYMVFQMPNIKIKLGNFQQKADAEKMRKLIIDMKLVPNNIYLLPETIEIKPEKKDIENP